MKNHIQKGCTLTVLAPYNLKSGEFFVVGIMFGIASNDTASGQPVEMAIGEVYALPKAAGQVWAQGVAIYWDATAKVMTTNSNAGANLKVAAATDAAISAATVGNVRLNFSF